MPFRSYDLGKLYTGENFLRLAVLVDSIKEPHSSEKSNSSILKNDT